MYRSGLPLCLPECFSFLRRSPARTSEDRYELPALQKACSVARQARCKLAARTLTVCGRLLPVGCCILGDVLRPGGPRHGVKNARRVRKAVEKLGPAFIKLGQAVAAREDVLSTEVATELRKLCDQVVPIPLEQARKLLEEELGPHSPPLQDEMCVAAASLGQVYRIKLGDQEFAMKIQRPGLADGLAVDVVILMKTAAISQRVYSWFAVSTMDFVKVVCAWAQTLWQELDYNLEARNMEHMREQLLGGGRSPGLVIPRVHWPLSGMRVLTTEWVKGRRLTESLSCVTPRHISVGVDAFAMMVLDMGLVHADPHAGNVLITEDNEVCLLDFGMVVEVPVSHRLAWAKCLWSMIRKDHNQTLDNLIEIGFFPPDCPRERMLEVMPKIWTELVDCGSNIEKRKQAVQKCFSEVLTLVREFEFDLPDYYLALARAMLTLEGIAIAADVEFDIFEAAKPCVIRYLVAQGKIEAMSLGRRLSSKGYGALTCCPRCKHEKSEQQIFAKLKYVLCFIAGVASVGAIAGVGAMRS